MVRFLTLTAAVATLLATVHVGGAASAPSAQAAQAAQAVQAAQAAPMARLADLEDGVVRELNRVRAANGLRPLAVAPGLASAAASHSAAMLAAGSFDHESADGTSFAERVRRTYPARGFRSWSVGENLLFNAGSLGAAAAVEAWLGSPPHRANMLSPSFREVGVGAAYSRSAAGDFGRGPALVITLDFGARTPLAP